MFFLHTCCGTKEVSTVLSDPPHSKNFKSTALRSFKQNSSFPLSRIRRAFWKGFHFSMFAQTVST